MGRCFDELDDRELQERVMFLSAELILADGRVDPRESALLRLATERWGPRRVAGAASPAAPAAGTVHS